MKERDVGEDQLAAMAVLVRRIYFEERRRFIAARQGRDDDMGLNGQVYPTLDGGEDKRGVKHESIWPVLARFIVDHELEPSSYIRGVFAAFKGNNPPWPTYFTNEKNLKRISQHCKADLLDVRIRFQNYVRRVNFEIEYRHQNRGGDIGVIERGVILDPGIETEDIFRYCAAMSLGQFDLAGSYYNRAIVQYALNSKVYEEVLGVYLNDQFRKDAREFRARLSVV